MIEAIKGRHADHALVTHLQAQNAKISQENQEIAGRIKEKRKVQKQLTQKLLALKNKYQELNEQQEREHYSKDLTNQTNSHAQSLVISQRTIKNASNRQNLEQLQRQFNEGLNASSALKGIARNEARARLSRLAANINALRTTF